jgi:hypothetical protein
VNLSDLTSPSAVESAMDEFDELGRDAFLEKYGYWRARRYFVRPDGNFYDSKAIAGLAVGYQHPNEGALPKAPSMPSTTPSSTPSDATRTLASIRSGSWARRQRDRDEH